MSGVVPPPSDVFHDSFWKGWGIGEDWESLKNSTDLSSMLTTYDVAEWYWAEQADTERIPQQWFWPNYVSAGNHKTREFHKAQINPDNNQPFNSLFSSHGFLEVEVPTQYCTPHP